MTALTLPEPIAAYFVADQQSPEAVVRCFTAQAVVKDEGRSHVGLDAIRAWKLAATSQYNYTCEPFAMVQQNGRQLVTSRVTGNFPGSPVDLKYDFRLDGDLIASLTITL